MVKKTPYRGAEGCGSDGLGGAVGRGRGGGLRGSFGLLLLRFLSTEGGAAGVLRVDAGEGVREGARSSLASATWAASVRLARLVMKPRRRGIISTQSASAPWPTPIWLLRLLRASAISVLRESLVSSYFSHPSSQATGSSIAVTRGFQSAERRVPRALRQKGSLREGLVDVGEAVWEDQCVEGLGLGDMDTMPTARLDAKIELDATILGVDPVVGHVAVGEVFDALFVGFLGAGDVDGEDGNQAVELADVLADAASC